MAGINSNQLTQAGDYTLELIELISYRINGEENTPYRMNIKPITLSVELTEDIFKSSMTGVIRVYDTQDVRTVLPITGLERLNLKFSTPGMRGVVANEDEGHPFHIYKVDNVRQDTGNSRGQFYDIYFCSQEMYFDSITRVSKAYKGPIEDGLEDIFRNKNYLNSKKKLFFEPTKTNTKLVIPNIRPFMAIEQLGRQAISANYANSGYLMYENTDGYFFRSIESMLAISGAKARPAKFNFKDQISNTRSGDVRDIVADMRSIIKYDFVRPVNILENIRTGMYGNKLIRHDAFDKTITTTNFDYAESFGDYFHTEHNEGDRSPNKSMLPYSLFEDRNKDLSQEYDARLMTVAQTSKKHNDFESILKSETTQRQVSQLQQLKQANLSLLVHGNSLVKTGDVITFDLPLMRPLGDNKRQEMNPYYSGRYLVMSIRHVISVEAGRYEMIMRCMKDAVQTPYAQEIETNILSEQSPTISNIYEEDNNILSGDILERI